MNPMYRGPTTQLNQNNPYNEMMNTMNELQRGNPQAVIQQMFARNPEVAQRVQGMLNQGISPQQAVMNMLNSGNCNGFNPQQILNMMNNFRH